MTLARRRFHDALWPRRKPVVGVIHLLPLPGSPGWRGSMTEVRNRALGEAAILADGGLDGIILENYMDVPFFPGPVPPETVAGLAVVAQAVVDAFPLPVGINVLRNDPRAALAVVAATGAAFIRVNVHTGAMYTDQGLIQGGAHATLRQRAALDLDTGILADVLVKHATPPPGATLEGTALDTWERGLADGIIVTGSATGAPVDPDDLRRVREALPPEGRVWVGSGVVPGTAAALLEAADGLIVGSALQAGGRAGGGVEKERVAALAAALGR